MPSNTPIAFWTNLAYLVAGIAILRGFRVVRIKGDTQELAIKYRLTADAWPNAKHFHVRTLASWLVGLSFVALGIGSGLHHWFNMTNAPPTQWWAQLADERGMYICFSVLAGVVWDNVGRQSKVDGLLAIGWEKQVIPKIGLAIGLVLAAFAAEPWVDSMWMMPALAVICIAGVGVGQSWGRALRFFVGFLAIAAIRELPEANFWARDPLFGYDIIHGGWHLFTGLFMYYLYKSTEG